MSGRGANTKHRWVHAILSLSQQSAELNDAKTVYPKEWSPI
jgi:hypothetical protein